MPSVERAGREGWAGGTPDGWSWESREFDRRPWRSSEEAQLGRLVGARERVRGGGEVGVEPELLHRRLEELRGGLRVGPLALAAQPKRGVV